MGEARGRSKTAQEEFQALFSRAEGNSSESSTVATNGSGAILFAIAERVWGDSGAGGNGEVNPGSLGGVGARRLRMSPLLC